MPRRLCLFFLALFAARLGAETVVPVGPSSAPLPVTGVPFLNEEVPEATERDHGLAIAPEVPFRWTTEPGPEAAFPVSVEADPASFDHAVLTLWNWHNRPIGQWKIDSGEARAFRFAVAGRGVYQLTLDGYRNGECTRRLVRSFAVVDDLSDRPWRSDQFFLGICAFPGRYHWNFQGVPTLPLGISETEARELEADLMAGLGFRLVRVDESMEMGETGDPERPYQYDFTRMDAAVEAYVSRGFRLALQTMNSPGWATEDRYAEVDEPLWRYPKRDAPQRAYTRALVERYGKHAEFVQVFNEPDQVAFWSGTPEEYLRHYRSARDEVRGLFPDLPIANGGYSLFDPERTRYFAGRLRDEVEITAYHSHGTLARLREDHERLRRMLADADYPDDSAIANTEMGFDGWRLDQERRKGQIVPQKALHCWSSGHVGVLLFGSRMTLGPNRVTQDFGFLDHWFCPRYVYGSVGAMILVLSGAVFEETLLDRNGTHVHRFRRGGEEIVVVFSETDDAPELRFSATGERVESVDEMGNRVTVTNPEEIRLVPDGYPRYLVAHGGGIAMIVGAD